MSDDSFINVTQFIRASDAAPSEEEAPRLLAVTGPLTGAHFAIVVDPVTIGREPENSICLGAPGVSRQHCQIVREPDGGLAIVDNNSTNGTVVNGRPLKPDAHRRLHHGDTIDICESSFFFLNPQASSTATVDGKLQIDFGAAAKEAEGFLTGCSEALSLRKARRSRASNADSDSN